MSRRRTISSNLPSSSPRPMENGSFAGTGSGIPTNCPGGHREAEESILDAATRELREETGALDFSLVPICAYSVVGKNQVNPSGEEAFGMLYVADIIAFEPELHREIEQVLFLDELPRDLKPWTYPMIQPKLVEEAKRRNLV